MSARTAVLAVISITDGNAHDVYTCPGAITTILKTINYNNAGAAAGSLTIMLRRAGSPYWLVNTSSLAANSPQQLSVWIAMTPNDVLRIVTSCNPLTVWVSGTKLDGVSA